jgi:hypothetical protein
LNRPQAMDVAEEGKVGHEMKKVSKFGLLLAVALMACTAMAVGAQAQDINPDSTTITGTADFPSLDYEGVLVQCDTGTAVGTTGSGTDPSVNVALEFFGNCNINGLEATVACSDASGTDDSIGTAALEATNGTTNTGIVEQLNSGFSCVVTVPGVCTVSVGAQELPSDVDGSPGRDQANLLNEGADAPNPVNDTISGVVDVEAARTGSSLCGPAQGDGGFTGDYVLDTNITFD